MSVTTEPFNQPDVIEGEVLSVVHHDSPLPSDDAPATNDDQVVHPTPRPYQAQTDGAPAASSTPHERPKKSFKMRGGTPRTEQKTPTNSDADDAKVPPLPRGGIAAKKLADIYMYVGMYLSLVDPVCGKAIIDAGPQCATALEEMAKTNAGLRRVLHKMIEGSGYTALIVAHTPILLAVGGHHMPDLFGPRTPAPQAAPTVREYETPAQPATPEEKYDHPGYDVHNMRAS